MKKIDSLSSLNSALSARSKRAAILVVAVLAVLGISMLIGSFSSKTSANRRLASEKPTVEIYRDEKVTGIEQLGADLQLMQRRLDESTGALNRAMETIEKQSAAMAELRQKVDELSLSSGLPDATPAQASPISEQAASVPTFTQPKQKPQPLNLDLKTPLPLPQPLSQPTPGARPEAAPVAQEPAPSGAAAERAQPAQRPQPLLPHIRAVASDGKDYDHAAEHLRLKEAYDQSRATKEPTVFMPAGSMFSAVLLTGVDMPTSMATQQNPVPVVFRIKREAILPNFASIDVRECFLLGSGYGQMSSERAILRAEAISCVTNQNRVLETTFNAFIVGGDGKVGIPGRLVSKQGAMIARSLLAGVFSGIAGQSSPSAVPQLNLNPGARTQWQNPDPQAILENGVTSGFSAAANSVARFYLKMAEETFPVIEVSAGEGVTVVVTQGGAFPLKGSTQLEKVDIGKSASASVGQKTAAPQPALQPSQVNAASQSAQPTAAPSAQPLGPAWQSGQSFGRPPSETQVNNPLSSIEGPVRDLVRRATAP